MDEAIRVYLPRKQLTVDRILEDWDDIDDWDRPVHVPEKTISDSQEEKVKDTTDKKKAETKWESRLNTLKEVLANQRKREMDLRFRHPGFNLVYNWILAILIASLMIGSIWAWSHNRKVEKEQSIYATAYAEGKADVVSEQQAQAEAEANSQAAYKKKIDDLMTADTQLVARFLQGIEGFETNEKYNYTPIDVETYGQCPINRVLDETEFAWCTTLEQAIMQENQWVGMSLNNQPTQRNVQIAQKLVHRLYAILYPDLYEDDPMPCSSKYCWTEFTKDGLWLKSTYGTATFNNTWRAG